MPTCRPWLPAAVLLCLLVVLWGGGAFLSPLSLQLGAGASEGPIHLWSLWVTAEKLFAHGPLVRVAPEVAFPDGFAVHLMDPISLLLFLPGYWLGGGGVVGASLGWNLLHAGAMVLAGLGCYRLARVFDPQPASGPWTAAVMVAAFAGGSFLLSHPYFGRTEYLPLVLMPWHLALLLPWARGKTSWKSGVAAGLLLGAVALGGGYAGTFALLLELPLAGWLLLVTPGRSRVLRRLTLVAGVGLLIALPIPIALLMYPPLSLGSLSEPVQFLAPTLRVEDLGWLLRLNHPGPGALLMDQPVYPGVVLLLLAIVGAVLRPRQAVFWLLLGLWLLALSLGQLLDLSDGHRLPLPAAFLADGLPPLEYIKFWSRLGILVPLPLAIAACLGLAGVLRRLPSVWRPVVGLALVAAILADQATWPRPWSSRPSFQASMPADLEPVLERMAPGALLQLPLEVPTSEGQLVEIGFGILWQRQHGRSVSATPAEHGDQLLYTSNIARFAVNLQAGNDSPGPKTPPTDKGDASRVQQFWPGQDGAVTPALAACLRADAAALAQQGVAGLVLHIDRTGGPALAMALERALGKPSIQQGQILAWELGTQGSEPAATGCEPFPLTPVAAARLTGLQQDDLPDILLVVVAQRDVQAPSQLDGLATTGVRFERVFRNAPRLDEALVTGLAGRLPGAGQASPLTDGAGALPVALGTLGYHTAAWWGPGWDLGASSALGFDAEHRADEIDSVLGWLEAGPEQPWFAVVTIGPLGDSADGAGPSVDALLKALDAGAGEGQTLVVGVAGVDFSGAPAVESLRDEHLALDLVISDPSLRGGWTVGAPIQLMDLSPTLLERAGWTTQPSAHGRSLIPKLRGNAPVVSSLPIVVVATDGAALRVVGHKLIQTGERTLLYDLEADPGETIDLAEAEPELARRLGSQLAQLRGLGRPDARRGEHPTPRGDGPPATPRERLAGLQRERQEVLAAIQALEASGASASQLDAERQRLDKRLFGIDIRLRPLLQIQDDPRGDPSGPALAPAGR